MSPKITDTPDRLNNGMSGLAGKEIFLATTSLEDFWDTARPIVFLTEACRRYSRRQVWEPLRGAVIPNLWDSQKKIYQFYDYVNNIYEMSLEILGKILNRIHAEDHNKRYWRILIGMWLYYYISLLYEKYSYIQEARRLYPGFTTIGLSSDSFIVPRDTLDFAQYMKEDAYNLQIFTKIFEKIGMDFRKRSASVKNIPFGAPLKEPAAKLMAKDFLKKALATAQRVFPSETLVLKNSYFSNFLKLQLTLCSFGKIRANNSGLVKLEPKPVNCKIRSQLQEIKLGDSEFEKLLCGILPFEIPQCYMESYSQVREYASWNYPRKVKAIFTSNAWCFDEAFKYWAADAAQRGTILLGGQHGGNYGSLSMLAAEDHEIAITDRFYSWGWERKEFGEKVYPMPAPNLIRRRRFSAGNKNTGILLTTSLCNRYFFNLPYFSEKFKDYLSWQQRFLKALDCEIRALLRIRLHREDYGWDISERIKSYFPEVLLENWSRPFLSSLQDCRLFIADGLKTTFAEALSANKPTVMFWEPESTLLRPEARPYYDLLREAGILYYQPEEAAGCVNSIYKDVQSWWNNPQRKSARREFCDKFARQSDQGIKEWLKEFDRVVKIWNKGADYGLRSDPSAGRQ